MASLSIRDETSEIDFEKLVKEEFLKLHRQYRLMEDARQDLQEDYGKATNQAGKLVRVFESERSSLLTDIANSESLVNRIKDKKSIRHILDILQKYEEYMLNIRQSLLTIDGIESEVDKIQKRIIEQKLKVRAIYGQTMTYRNGQRRLMLLENRLYHHVTQFDTICTRNKAIREEINMMLRLRGNFYKRLLAYKKLMHQIKVRNGDIVYQASNAYEKRDEHVNKIHSLKDRNDKDSKQHVLEIKEFTRILHHDSKLRDFMGTKNRIRELQESSYERETRRMNNVLGELEYRLALYEHSFKIILKMAKSLNTKPHTIEGLIQHYELREQKNFGAFKYLSDLNHEISALKEANMNTVKEIEEIHKETTETDRARMKEMLILEEKLQEQKEKFIRLLKEWNKTEANMEKAIGLLDDVFNMTKCTNASIIILLGNMNGINPFNAHLCMTVLEHRISELIFKKSILEIRRSHEVNGLPLPKKAPPFGYQGLKPKSTGGPFKPPRFQIALQQNQGEDEEDAAKATSERPFSYIELRDSILSKMRVLELKAEESTQEVSELVSINDSLSDLDFERSAALNVYDGDGDQDEIDEDELLNSDDNLHL